MHTSAPLSRTYYALARAWVCAARLAAEARQLDMACNALVEADVARAKARLVRGCT